MWTKQIAHTLRWRDALLSDESLTLRRTFHLSTYRGHGVKVEVCLDASPWGLGGFLVKDGIIVSYWWPG